MMRVLTTLALSILFVVAPAAAGSPVVTPWEYRHAQINMSRHAVHRLYDTRGEYVVAWYGEAGHLWIQRRYPTSDGSWTTVIYRDSHATVDGSQQGTMQLRRKAW